MIGSTSTSCCEHMTHFPPSKPHFSALQCGCFLEGMEPVFLGFEEVGRCVGSRPSSVGEEKSPTQPRSFPFNAPLAATSTTSKGSSNKFAFFLTRHACLFNYFSGSVKDFLEMEIDCCKFELIIIFCHLSLNVCLSLSQKYLPLQSRLVLVRSRFRNMRCHYLAILLR